MEWLTDEMEKKAYEIIERIEKMGGFIRAYESGWLRDEIANEAAAWRHRVENGEEIVVGLNRYQDVSKELKVPVFSVDEGIEQRAIARIQAYRKDRDQSKCQETLDRLRLVARKIEQGEGDEYLMDALIEAYRARATLGETMAILKDVFGYGYVY
jgi:methylmalonyl-CoA mutase N-terminal domain/subunit